jgi:polyisoprenoid-binding protein YceI
MRTVPRIPSARKLPLAVAAIACAWLAAVSPVAAQPAAPTTPLGLAPGSRLWLAGDSTLHPFTSNATQIEATAKLDGALAGDPAEARAAIVGGGLRSLSVSVPVEGLKSGEGGLDKNLRKALKQESAPVIRFTLVDYQAEPAKDGSLVVKARGRLAIAGVEKEAVVDGACRFGPDGIEITGTKELLMSDFGVKPPTLMLGAIKTADKVVVHFALKLKASDATPGKRS